MLAEARRLDGVVGVVAVEAEAGQGLLRARGQGAGLEEQGGVQAARGQWHLRAEGTLLSHLESILVPRDVNTLTCKN